MTQIRLKILVRLIDWGFGYNQTTKRILIMLMNKLYSK